MASTSKRTTTSGPRKVSRAREKAQPEFNEAYLRVSLANIARGVVSVRGVTGEFFDLDVFPYQDFDKSEKFAVFVAFVQDYRDPDESLEVSVLKELVNHVKSEKLQSLVNDISVNALQWRNNRVSRRTLGGDDRG